MDVISFISDGFNIYFPMLIFILCLATFFNLGGHVLHFFGFDQFIGDAEITQDLIEDGKNLVKREKRRLQRNDPEVQVRHRDLADKLKNNYSTASLTSKLNRNNNQPSSGNESSSSRNIDIESGANNSKGNFFSKSALGSYKDAISSSLPSFLTKGKSTSTNGNTLLN